MFVANAYSSKEYWSPEANARRKSVVALERDPSHPVWRVDQYHGQARLDVAATGLAARGVAKPSEQRRILREWIDFFAGGPTGVRHLNLVSRVPQELLDAVAGQTQLELLYVKMGPYASLEPLAQLTELRVLSLGGASKVEDLSPLAALAALHSLTIDQPFGVRDLRPLSAMRWLRELSYGNGYLGSDGVVDITDLQWVRALSSLRVLNLPGTRLPPEELAALTDLPMLTSLRIPLRRAYRKLVLEYAARNEAFAGVAKDYEGYDAFRTKAPLDEGRTTPGWRHSS